MDSRGGLLLGVGGNKGLTVETRKDRVLSGEQVLHFAYASPSVKTFTLTHR